jgi:hypothetical protein
VLIAFGSLMLLYVILGFAMAILTSQMMVILQGDEAGARLEKQSKPRVRWYGILSMMGYHPLNPSLWFEIVRASDLPSNALKKQREMRIVFAALIAALATLGILMIFGG